jgi:hypothetical protein
MQLAVVLQPSNKRAGMTPPHACTAAGIMPPVDWMYAPCRAANHLSHCVTHVCVSLTVSLTQTNKYHGLPEVLLTPDTIVLNTWRLISFVLSLLMAFRINRTYER